jgi:hypothetical protein
MTEEIFTKKHTKHYSGDKLNNIGQGKMEASV